MERKKRNHERERELNRRRASISRIDLAQESNALPVTYCDSQASL